MIANRFFRTIFSKRSRKQKEAKMDFDRSYADYLDPEGIAAIEQLESETNTRILAYWAPPKTAQLGQDQLDRIKALEEKLCVRLVAYDQGY